MTAHIALAILGLVILVLAGDALVRGAVNLALRLGISALVVSLTVVAFGTSAPELLVSIQAVLGDAPGLALGNVVGSNIANVLLVLGLPAIISCLDPSVSDTRKNYIFMLCASLVFVVLAFLGPFVWWHGLILLAVFALILGDQIRHAFTGDAPEELPEELEEADPSMPYWKIGMYLGLGLIGLPLGADLLIDSATEIARAFGVSEVVIGLTLVALGTSLPELATSVMAALRKHADVALGNVIGSNIFNLLFIFGVAPWFGAIPVDGEFLRFDLWVMLGTSLILLPFVFFRWRMARAVGLLFVALYIGYVSFLLH
ncbi:calcium/sodium antiporter [Rhodobacterales bacterium LSUCC1028]|jgi:cation:H+ antiporter|nr:calcium/sodium antiporter [Rhodobacterales bacterium FZCC0188]MBF9053912.1 calcium/sodium antiporter [Rhodobacterales bacterium LSUCC1028]